MQAAEAEGAVAKAAAAASVWASMSLPTNLLQPPRMDTVLHMTASDR